MEPEEIDPQLAALQILSRKAGMGTPDEDAPVTTAVAPPPVAQPNPNAAMQRYVDAPTTQAAYRELPASAQPRQVPRETGFDWGRALTAFGGGDVGSYDARRQYQDAAGMRAKSEQMTDLRAKDMEEDLADRQEQRRRLRAMMDPTSVESKMEQENFASIMRARANAPGLGKDTAAYFNQLATSAPTMNATQIARAKLASDQIYGDTFKAIDSLNRGQKIDDDMQYKRDVLDATRGNQAENRQVAWANVNETAAHHRAMEGIGAKSAEGKLPPEGNQKSYREAEDALAQIDKALDILNRGKVRYLGAGAEALNAGASMAPGGLDPRNEDERELGATVGELSAEKKHNLYGSVLSSGEQANSKQFVPSVSMNKETLKKSLEMLRERARKHVALNDELYPALRKATERANAAMAPSAPGPVLRAPPGAVPGQRKRNPNDGKWYIVQPDLTMKPE